MSDTKPDRRECGSDTNTRTGRFHVMPPSLHFKGQQSNKAMKNALFGGGGQGGLNTDYMKKLQQKCQCNASETSTGTMRRVHPSIHPKNFNLIGHA